MTSAPFVVAHLSDLHVGDPASAMDQLLQPEARLRRAIDRLASLPGRIDALVVTTGLPVGVTLIPARPQLSELDHALSRFVDRTRLLERGLAESRCSYDYILLDCDADEVEDLPVFDW